MSAGDELSSALRLRRDFDEGFVCPARTGDLSMQDLLAIRVGGEGYAVRLGEVVGLLPRQKIVALPSPVPELLGVAGLRGGVVPIYSLAALLGYGAGAETSRWTILMGPDLVGLAFETFDGYLRVSPGDLAAEHGGGSRPHVVEIARVANRTFGIIDLPSVRCAVEVKARIGRDASGSTKET
jgi:chemotaxis signal transduction protein